MSLYVHRFRSGGVRNDTCSARFRKLKSSCNGSRSALNGHIRVVVSGQHHHDAGVGDARSRAQQKVDQRVEGNLGGLGRLEGEQEHRAVARSKHVVDEGGLAAVSWVVRRKFHHYTVQVRVAEDGGHTVAPGGAWAKVLQKYSGGTGPRTAPVSASERQHARSAIGGIRVDLVVGQHRAACILALVVPVQVVTKIQ